MQLNPPVSSVITASKIGSKLQPDDLCAKLITINETVPNHILKARNKYWFVVARADLQVKIFSFTNDTLVDVTHEYLIADSTYYYGNYTIFSAKFPVKALSLVIAWYTDAVLYTDSYFVRTTPIIVSPHVLEDIYRHIFGEDPPLPMEGPEAMDIEHPVHTVTIGSNLSDSSNQHATAFTYNDSQRNNNNTPISHTDPSAREYTNENDDFEFVHGNDIPTVVDFPEALDPYIHPNTVNNTNVVHEAQANTENNTNVRRNIDDAPSQPPVVKRAAQKERYQRVLTIVATELARKWTWAARVLNERRVVLAEFDELYMRGGQAVNSVILRCKQEMYELYPGDDIYFDVQVRPRRKDPLKLRGQKFLNAVMFAWWSKQPESVTVDELSNSNIETDHPITQHRARPVNVTDNNTVVIMVFELEYPQSPEHACWIIQACDDDKQLAIELRTQTYSLDERARVIAEMKRCVRVRLARDVYYHDITFKEDIQQKKPDKLRAWAYWWLGAATTRATNFANWAGGMINYFTGNNHNNQNQL